MRPEICNHRILGRVRLLRILNPSAWEDMSTYLRAEVEDFMDTDTDDPADDAKEQEEVMDLLQRVAVRQEELGGPHFESHLSDYANASCAEDGGLWTLADVFAEYFEFLQSEKEQTLDLDIEQVYHKYGLEDDDQEEEYQNFFASIDDDQTPGQQMSSQDESDYEYEEVDLMDLPSSARTELWRLQEQFEEEASVLQNDLMAFVHQMLQSTSHRERLQIMRSALMQEERRLAVRKALQSVMMAPSEEKD
ncbi:Uncharacterized protein SCF082_LOCUS12350 [Durusdinium trenchii]|uniref:Uncharacterized protein n=1 Tax=Durusdinium trenchii TaxID=1381693 RepID=A0ABP0JJF5_9DINO